MRRILVITDAPWIRNEVHAALYQPEHELIDHSDPRTAAARAADGDIDAVVVDLQVGSMGGMAITRAVRNTVARDDSDPLPIVMLLDRTADAFLARRAGATRWVVKPFSSNELRIALRSAVAIEEIAADEATERAPSDILVEPPVADETTAGAE